MRAELKAADSDDYVLTPSSVRPDFELRRAIFEEEAEDERARLMRVKKELLVNAVSLLKGQIFKRDHPYRTKLTLQGELATDASGILNFNYAINQVVNCAEWTSIDVLFDEVFVHSMTFKYFPYNLAQQPKTSDTTYLLTVNTTSSSAQGYTLNQPWVAVALFGGSGTYSSAVGMVNNPNHKLGHSAKPFKYAWLNNTRFDRRGLSLNPSSSIGWSGWVTIGNAAKLDGILQIRSLNNLAFGDGTHSVTPGGWVLYFDVSFRSRS